MQSNAVLLSYLIWSMVLGQFVVVQAPSYTVAKRMVR